ncbi:hypothetical protein EON65_34390 [archaeon]|nr:MAG: hypothetical protein EON65_34390 [archaeon]
MVKTESEIIETIKEALKQAENLQLQGGRAIEYEATLHAFRGCWSILQTHSDYNSRHWYVDYCVRCRQSMAQIYSIQSNFAEAESSVQEAIYIIIQGQENNFGQNFSSSRAENMQCQLLTLVSIAISDVCLNSANTHGIEKALSLLTWYLSLLRTNTSFGSSTSSISSALGSFVFNVTASCMAENPDPVIASFCIPAIPALHNHFIKSQEFYLHKLASIISSVYMSMGQYAAAVHVYSHALDHAEPYYIGNGASSSSEQEKTVVLDMRRGYVDCVLRCYEALQSNAHMYRVWLDKVLSNMRQIGCFAPQDKEMWGDLLVLSGGLDSQVLGFCVYVAWHHAHGLGANTQVTRMNAKLKKLVDKVEVSVPYSYLSYIDMVFIASLFIAYAACLSCRYYRLSRGGYRCTIYALLAPLRYCATYQWTGNTDQGQMRNDT